MRVNDEFVERVHECFVKDDCVQLMFPYQEFMFLFGNNDILYYRNILDDKVMINKYLDDRRRFSFPYSSIPLHIERVGLFYKIKFVNQILDFEKPYIKINDSCCTIRTVFKDGNSAIVHTKIVDMKNTFERQCTLSRSELHNFLKTGFLFGYDENEYSKIFLINGDAKLSKNEFSEQDEQRILGLQRKKLLDAIGRMNINDCYVDSIKKNLRKGVSKLDEFDTFEVCNNNLLIKLKENGDIKVDKISIFYLNEYEYALTISNIPITKQTLNMIKSNCKLSKIRPMIAPKISLNLNPNITKEQLKEEKQKVMVKK